jgi:NAD(P)-dependent dehydrogenase (short-subunit alcohol dehydrogenase family)
MEFHQLDVTDPDSMRRLAADAVQRLGRVDILVNNAAVFLERLDDTVEQADLDVVRATLMTNLIGAWRMCQAILPLMQRQRSGRIVNVSSGSGQLSEIGPGHPGYRVSKTALNALTGVLAAELAGTNILVNAVCPGWVRTDMGGPDAPRTVAEGADTVVWAALLPDGGPSGRFFRDRRPIPW